jgi:hypothetical protein
MLIKFSIILIIVTGVPSERENICRVKKDLEAGRKFNQTWASRLLKIITGLDKRSC